MVACGVCAQVFIKSINLSLMLSLIQLNKVPDLAGQLIIRPLHTHTPGPYSRILLISVLPEGG
jgi:hypothetical protein